MHKKGRLSFAFAFLCLLVSPIAYSQITYQEEDRYYSDGVHSEYQDSGPYYSDQNGYPSRTADDTGNISMQPDYEEPISHPPDDSSYYYNAKFANGPDPDNESYDEPAPKPKALTDGRLPIQIAPPGEKVIVIDPRAHAWGAYLPDGRLIRSGLASAGAKWCRDRGRPCRTKIGSFRIFSLGDSSCVSSIYPLNEGGGAPMPYCMFFNGNQGLHGSHQLAEANISHGCVRISVSDAKWIRFEFARIGTKVIVKPY